MSSDLTYKQKFIVEQVSKGIDLKDALINAGYSSNAKSLESQITRLNKNESFLKELQGSKEKIIHDQIISSKLDKARLATEFYEYYQELRANDDPSNALKALNSLKDLLIEKQGSTQQIKHEHKISFENLLSDMKKGIEEKPIISIN